MIYEVLVRDEEFSFEQVMVHVTEEHTTTKVKTDQWEIVYRIKQNDSKIDLVFIKDAEGESYLSDTSDFPEDSVYTLTHLLSSIGKCVFVWGGKLHRIDWVIEKESSEYHYTYEWSKTFNRKIVMRHPKIGVYFELHPNERTYEIVPNDKISSVMEQAERLNTNAGIPSTWLKREPSVDGFIYTPVK